MTVFAAGRSQNEQAFYSLVLPAVISLCFTLIGGEINTYRHRPRLQIFECQSFPDLQISKHSVQLLNGNAPLRDKLRKELAPGCDLKMELGLLPGICVESTVRVLTLMRDHFQKHIGRAGGRGLLQSPNLVEQDGFGTAFQLELLDQTPPESSTALQANEENREVPVIAALLTDIVSSKRTGEVSFRVGIVNMGQATALVLPSGRITGAGVDLPLRAKDVAVIKGYASVWVDMTLEKRSINGSAETFADQIRQNIADNFTYTVTIDTSSPPGPSLAHTLTLGYELQ